MKPTLIMLHGWGGSKKSLQGIIEKIDQEKINLIIPDLPGFGEEKAPESEWGIDNYINFVLKLAAKNNLGKFYLFGHSFGGRIGIKLSAKYPEKISGLILCASAGIKHQKSCKQITFYLISKLGKKIFQTLPLLNNVEPFARKILYWIIGERDYYLATETMRRTMKNVINEDLTFCLSQIQSRTLIIWGDKDKITPIKDATLIHQKINNSQLRIINDVGHYLPKEKPEIIAQFINSFIIDQKK